MPADCCGARDDRSSVDLSLQSFFDGFAVLLDGKLAELHERPIYYGCVDLGDTKSRSDVRAAVNAIEGEEIHYEKHYA